MFLILCTKGSKELRKYMSQLPPGFQLDSLMHRVMCSRM
uniref:Uncharacterized protein n=1 Tax=Anguilla anguilla TaxID=7936 RepID=A0A0E9WD58_ANGAN